MEIGHSRSGSDTTRIPLTQATDSPYRLTEASRSRSINQQSLFDRVPKRLLWALCAILFLIMVILSAVIDHMRSAASSSSASPSPSPDSAASRSLQQLAADIDATRDTSLDPCQDFFQYACGKWLSSTELPPSESRWSRSFSVIEKRNQRLIRKVVEDNWPVIGPMYTSCMNVDDIERVGVQPIQTYLQRIDVLKNNSNLTVNSTELWSFVGQLMSQLGILSFFDVDLVIDSLQPQLNMIQLSQGGLSLPDRSYYFDNETRLNNYRQHVVNMLNLLSNDSGTNTVSAEADAQVIVEFEKSMAAFFLSPASLRNPNLTYNAVSDRDLQDLAPVVNWNDLFSSAAVSPVRLNVQTRQYFTQLNQLLQNTSVDTLLKYVQWRVIHGTANHLTAAFRNENFAFFEQQLRGVKQPLPRFEKCINVITSLLGDISGRYFVEQAFNGSSTQKANALIRDIKEAFRRNLVDVDWLDEATRKAAETKLDLIYELVGAPVNWTDYSAVHIVPNAYFSNLQQLVSFKWNLTMNRIHKPVDKNLWQMVASEVNAYYDPTLNSINFPAGIIQAPFFKADWPIAANFGGIGMVMAHELSHSVDDQGAQFNGYGKLQSWWTEEAGAAFKDRAKCYVDQYSNIPIPFSSNPQDHINGNLTLGENIADSGIKFAWLAYKAHSSSASQQRSAFSSKSEEPLPPTHPAITADELFFISFAQTWCTKIRPEAAHRQLVTDPHSPAVARVNVPLQNLPAFAETFKCPSNSPMNPQHKCKLW